MATVDGASQASVTAKASRERRGTAIHPIYVQPCTYTGETHTTGQLTTYTTWYQVIAHGQNIPMRALD